MMKILDKDTKFAELGKPGTAFTPGFQRRWEMIKDLVSLDGKQILDIGCGRGVWLQKFVDTTQEHKVFGTDIDPDSLEFAADIVPAENLVVAAGEDLPFDNNFFDVIFAHEVLEHVEDDKQVVKEVMRVLKPGGKFVFFTPNRGWPFEQHGIFLGDNYVWGNIPLLPWLPKWFQRRFAPHVRNYWDSDIRKLIDHTTNTKIIHHSHVFPGFDGLVRRWGRLGRVIRSIFHTAERTFLNRFGISHIVVVEKGKS